MKHYLIPLLLLGAILVTGYPLIAAETEQTTALDEMVVTAGRAEEQKRDVTVNIMVIDAQEIEMSTAQNLGQLLEDSSIGHIKRYPGALTTFGIRGFKGEAHGNDLQGYVLVLLNGRRAGTGNVAHMSTDNIERIEIIRGPSSVQYGSAAIGGLINIITRQGRDEPSLFVGGKLGSFGYEEITGGVSGKIRNFDLSVSARRLMKDDYDTAEDEDYENTGYGEKENVSLNLGYEFLPHNRLGVIYTYADTDKAGNPNYLVLNDRDDYADKEYDSLDITYNGQTDDGELLWNARYFTGEDESTWMDPVASNPDGWDDGAPYKYEVEQEGAQAQLTWKPGNHQLTTGIDWVNYEIDSSVANGTNEYDNPAGFVLGKIRLLDQRLILSGGMRYDEYDVDFKEETGGSEDDDNISPSAGIAFLLTDNLKFRVNYSEGFKMPSARQLAIDAITWGTHYIGNPNLDPEKSENYEAGVDYAGFGFSTSLTWFYTDFEDKIISVVDAAGNSTWDNHGDATVSGFEGDFSCDLGLFFDLGWELRPYANFVCLTEYKDKETREELIDTADLQATYGISISNYDDLSANLNFTYTGEQDYLDWVNAGMMGTPDVLEKGGYTTANLSLKKRLIAFDDRGKIDLTTEIRNLLDKDYEHAQGYPAPGRSYYAGLTYRY